MKKAELILGLIALTALALNLLLVPGGAVLTVVSLSSLAILYGYFGFALFNNIRLRHIFKKDSYKGIGAMRLVGAILYGFALSATVLGLLFKFMSWPGGTVELVFGLVGLTVALIVGGIKFSRTRSDYYTKIFKRVAIYGVSGLCLMLFPRYAWLEFKYRNHPAYVNAVKQAMADPGNQALQDRMNEEREKMNGRR